MQRSAMFVSSKIEPDHHHNYGAFHCTLLCTYLKKKNTNFIYLQNLKKEIKNKNKHFKQFPQNMMLFLDYQQHHDKRI